MATSTRLGAAACRDCFALFSAGVRSCPACGSVRNVAHAELHDLAIAHVDCDAFYAAVEKRDRPELVSVPVIVGGGKRGVVSTCCYLARTYGVRSAMPMFKALRACPDAVVIKPRMERYVAEGRKIRSMMEELTPLVEPVSIDEAYLDLSGTAALHGCSPAVSLMKLQQRVERELGLTISVGLSANKFLAKTASEADKPRGFFVLSPSEASSYLAPHSVRLIGGVGAQLAKKLAADGIVTIADLQNRGRERLIKAYGEAGGWLYERAFGRHDRPVDPLGERRSVSSETTLAEDLADRGAIEDLLWRLAERTADRAKSAGVEGRVVTLKLKTADFKVTTRRTALADGTQLAHVIFRTVRSLLAKEPLGGAYRLVGIGLSELGPARADAVDLGDPQAFKRSAAERAADRARARFGEAAVVTGRAAKGSKPSE